MMPLPKKHIVFPILVIILLISIPVLIINHRSISQESKLFAGVRERKAGTNFTKQSMLKNDKLILLKDSDLSINKCRLVFKGIKDKKIHIDLYLLELDPEYAYSRYISKADAAGALRLGGMDFELVSVNRNVLKLKRN